MKKLVASSQKLAARKKGTFLLQAIGYRLQARAFTLIETLVAVSLLSIAIVAPMTLASKSLATAYYARDQITAFHLAQEAIETVRHIRDHNIILTAHDISTPIMTNIILDSNQTSRTFVISSLDDSNTTCSGVCPPLKLDPTNSLYGYGDAGWTDSRFTRTVKAETVASDENGVPQEIRITVTVSWRSSAFQIPRTVTISENLYNWFPIKSEQ